MSSATVSSVPAQTIYQIKIVLIGIEPPIWRTVLCKSDATLAEFHDVIQVAMGWDDSHLHKFNVEDREIDNVDFRLDDYRDAEDEREITLEDVAPSFEYEYDFGDGWEHDVHIEKEVPYDPKVTYPYMQSRENANARRKILEGFGAIKVPSTRSRMERSKTIGESGWKSSPGANLGTPRSSIWKWLTGICTRTQDGVGRNFR